MSQLEGAALDLKTAAMRAIYSDIDAARYSFEADQALEALLAGCVVTVEDDPESTTAVLLDLWLSFGYQYGMPGGSVADYAAEAAVGAAHGWTVRIVDPDLVEELEEQVEAHALYPEDIFDRMENAGITVEAASSY